MDRGPSAAVTRDRRRAPRFRVRRASLRGHNLEARLLDFSDGGLGLETHAGLRIGATYRFRLFAGRGRPIAATVRWCRLQRTERRAGGEVQPVYRAGLALGESAAERWAVPESPISTPEGK